MIVRLILPGAAEGREGHSSTFRCWSPLKHNISLVTPGLCSQTKNCPVQRASINWIHHDLIKSDYHGYRLNPTPKAVTPGDDYKESLRNRNLDLGYPFGRPKYHSDKKKHAECAFLELS